MKTVVYAVLVAFALAGCNTLPSEATAQGSLSRTITKKDGSVETTSNKSDYAAYLDKVGESKPIFEMSCPASGCVIASLKVNAPNSGGKVAPPSVPKSFATAFTDGLFGLGHDVLSQTPWIVGMKVLTKGFEVANSSVDNSNRSVVNDSSNRSVVNDSSNHAVDNHAVDNHAVDNHAVDSHAVDNHSASTPTTP